jgi:hypothetical protein
MENGWHGKPAKITGFGLGNATGPMPDIPGFFCADLGEVSEVGGYHPSRVSDGIGGADSAFTV